MPNLSIAIIGYGKMGRQIKAAAESEGVKITSIIDPAEAAASSAEISAEINAESVRNADVGIDFSSPSAVLENVRRLANLGKDMVIGTTGWYNHTEEVKRIAEEQSVGIIYSPNFSIGMNLFFMIVEEAARLFDKVPEYDPYVYEMHHRLKSDAPSGTALTLGELLLKNIKRKKRLLTERPKAEVPEDEIHIASLRAGFNPGVHRVGFDSESDTIEMSHSSKSRAAYAKGALEAARWIKGRKGLHTFADVLGMATGEP